MINYLIQRPIAVFMAFTAFFILGIITYLNIPVSLLPDIDIPEISVHISGKNQSAREIENTVVAPLRWQLLQVGHLRDVNSETRDGSAVIRLKFEYGTDTELAFIEVNEKIDAAMGRLPRDVDRPRVVKASAGDIPVFQLNLTLKNKLHNKDEFLDLCEFSETVIKRRIEQLPQVALVDISGLMRKLVMIQPDMNRLKTAGITLSDIENVLSSNNIEPGGMVVKDGYYEYNIRFSAVMRTIEDMQNIYIRKNDKIYQLKELANIQLSAEKEHGMIYFNDQRAVSMSVIKQSKAKMDELKNVIDAEIDRLRTTYPNIEFQVSQNQTELLDFTISNLQQNLILAFIFILLVSAIFMRDVRSPLIIGLSMLVSLVISLLFFYLFHVSLNVVSLTGLILALGMMIDNSIIVTDNIGQYRKNGYSIDEACIKGTNEVITPMLSSAFTTISVFVPLIFLSGIAGAVFFDQAFSVAVGLMVSYVTGIILLPVLYKLIFNFKTPGFLLSFQKEKDSSPISKTKNQLEIHELIYHRILNWVFSHKGIVLLLMFAVLALCYWFFNIIPKEKMPQISQTELLVDVEWNEQISVEENAKRVLSVLSELNDSTIYSLTMIGQQQYLLTSDRELTSSESNIYLKVSTTDELEIQKKMISSYLLANYPGSIVSFSPASTIFEKIFDTGEPVLTAKYFPRTKGNALSATHIQELKNRVVSATGEVPITVPFQYQLNFDIDKEKMILYGASYHDIYQMLKTGFKENRFSTLRSYQQYLPIVLGGNEMSLQEMLKNSMIMTSTATNGKQSSAPLSAFVHMSESEDVKTIIADSDGEYIPFYYYETKRPAELIEKLTELSISDTDYEVTFSGSFFSNKKMINELVVILMISILLMYFILAAQFESFVQPLIVLIEIPIDIAASLGLLLLLGHSLNLMSAIGIVVTCGIIINDSILKIDIMNKLRHNGSSLMDAIHEAGHRRLNAILMTSITTIVCMLPLMFSHDLGSELEQPLAVATIGGMFIGTLVSLFVVPLVYWFIYRKKKLA